MSSQAFEQTSTQGTEETRPVMQHLNLVAQKLPFRQPQVGPLHHILQETGEGGSAAEYDSYKDNRK